MQSSSVLSIAGSDSSAGAGIQADLKTFSTLGLYGCTAITAITAQNTRTIAEIKQVSPELVIKQVNMILEDMNPKAIKIGMVYNKPIILGICKIIERTQIPTILDPVFTSTSNVNLLQPGAFQIFIKKLLPLVTIITPNIKEASLLSKVQISSENDIIKASQIIKEMGPENVIIKGSHLKTKKSVDILLTQDLKITKLSNLKLQIPKVHGSGCNFSAAITGFIAKGYTINKAFKMANEFINEALKNLIYIDNRNSIVDTGTINYISASKYNVLKELSTAIDELETIERIGKLIPETQSNFVYAIPFANKIEEVAGVKGRIVKFDDKVKRTSCLDFGTSKHIASAVITYMGLNPFMRSGFNIKYNKELIEICDSFLKISEYDRTVEPKRIKQNEGNTIKWGIKEALLKEKNANVIFHRGEQGKEAMIILFASNPKNILKYIKKILEHY